jgi:hypothetical protein
MSRSFFSILFFVLLFVSGCPKNNSHEEPSREQRLIDLHENVTDLDRLATYRSPARELNWVLYELGMFQYYYPNDLGADFEDLYTRTATVAGRYYDQIDPESYVKMCEIQDSLDTRDTDYLRYVMGGVMNLRQYLSADEARIWEDRVLEYSLVAPRYCHAFNTASIISQVWDSHSPRQEISEQIYQIALMQHAFCIKDGCLPRADHELLTVVSPDTFRCSMPDVSVNFAYHWGVRAGRENPQIGEEISTITSQCHATGYYTPLE